MKTRIYWKSLLKSHPEFNSFGVSLLVRHLSLILHCAVTRSQVDNLKRHGVLRLIADGIKPLPVDTKATAFFSFLFSRLFHVREFHPIALEVKTCKTHPKCWVVNWGTQKRAIQFQHMNETELRKRFFVSQRKIETEKLYVAVGSKMHEVSKLITWKRAEERIAFQGSEPEQYETDGDFHSPTIFADAKVSGAQETQRVDFVWAKSFKVGSTKHTAGEVIANGLQVVSKTTAKTVTQYINKEAEGWVGKDMPVRKSLYRTHAHLYDSIPLRAYGTGMSSIRSSLSPVFSPKDIEQQLCEKLFLACRGIDAKDRLGKLVARLSKAYHAKKRNARVMGSLIEELSAFMLASGKNLYLGMLRKEMRKVYTYDNRIDFLADASGFFQPVNTTGFDMIDA